MATTLGCCPNVCRALLFIINLVFMVSYSVEGSKSHDTLSLLIPLPTTSPPSLDFLTTPFSCTSPPLLPSSTTIPPPSITLPSSPLPLDPSPPPSSTSVHPSVPSSTLPLPPPTTTTVPRSVGPGPRHSSHFVSQERRGHLEFLLCRWCGPVHHQWHHHNPHQLCGELCSPVQTEAFAGYCKSLIMILIPIVMDS